MDKQEFLKIWNAARRHTLFELGEIMPDEIRFGDTINADRSLCDADEYYDFHYSKTRYRLNYTKNG